MKIKKYFAFLVSILMGICMFNFSSMVNAVTISDKGKYSLVLAVDDMCGDIEGEYAKLIRFDVAEGETTVKLSELTKGIVPFNGKNEFSHWETSEKKKAGEELALKDFTKPGNFYKSTGEEVNYTNGLSLNAKFEGKALKESGKYYLTLDAFGGTVNGKAKLLIESKKEDFKTVDLTKYTPVRKGYTFKGWDLDGKFVTSVDSSAFAKDVAISLTATYTADAFDGSDRVIVLDANGGTIDGEATKKYDYLGGGNSGTAMSLLPYVPVRKGYTFNGWNSKKDGSGMNYKYIYWRRWDKDDKDDLERDTIIKNSLGAEYYQNVTLYASWTNNSGETEESVKEPVKEIKSTGETKAKIEFADGISGDYELDVTPVEVSENLANKNIKYIVDINLLENGQVVKISDTKMKVKIALPEDLKGFNKYEVVYISDDEIKETIPATIEDGYIVFETSHLSQYGIIATNVEEKTEQVDNSETDNPKTGDNSNVFLWTSLFAVSALIAFVAILYSRKKKSTV